MVDNQTNILKKIHIENWEAQKHSFKHHEKSEIENSVKSLTKILTYNLFPYP